MEMLQLRVGGNIKDDLKGTIKGDVKGYVVFAHWMLCCPVERGGLTSCDRLNSSEKYLLLGFLLVRP